MDEIETSKLYYSISEVSDILGVNPSLIRFWEKEFEFLKPHKSKNGKRQFTSSDIDLLKLIYYLTKEKGFTLSGAKEQIKNNQKINENNMNILASLRKVRQFLTDLKDDIK